DLKRKSPSDAWDAFAMKAWQALWDGQLWPSFTVSVGMKGEPPVATNYADPNGFPIVMISKVWLTVGAALVGLALILFGWAAYSSDMLRNRGPEPAAGKRRPFSLARCQMAFWFFLVMVAYLVIWLATDNAGLSSSALGLLG